MTRLEFISKLALLDDLEFDNLILMYQGGKKIVPVSADLPGAEEYMTDLDVYDIDLLHKEGDEWTQKYPKLWKALQKHRYYWNKHEELNSKLGMDPKTTVTLNIPGSRLNGAVIDLQWIDKIVEIAQLTGTPIQEALGLAARETTFGNPTNDPSIVKLWSPLRLANAIKYEGFDPNAPAKLNIGVGKDLTWSLMFNYWDPYWWGDPYSKYMEYFMFQRDQTPATEESMEAWLSKYWNEIQKQEANYNLDDPITGALKLYNQGLYNTGLKDHTQKVLEDGADFMKDKNVRSYMQQKGYILTPEKKQEGDTSENTDLEALLKKMEKKDEEDIKKYEDGGSVEGEDDDEDNEENSEEGNDEENPKKKKIQWDKLIDKFLEGITKGDFNTIKNLATEYANIVGQSSQGATNPAAISNPTPSSNTNSTPGTSSNIGNIGLATVNIYSKDAQPNTLTSDYDVTMLNMQKVNPALGNPTVGNFNMPPIIPPKIKLDPKTPQINQEGGILKEIRLHKKGGSILDQLKELLGDSEIIDLLQHFGIDELMEGGLKNTGNMSISIMIESGEEPLRESKKESKKDLTRIEIGNLKYDVEIVTSEEDMEKGLGGRESLDSNKGMLFDFKETLPEVVFNMEEMKFPLDLVFINEDDEVIRVAENCLPGGDLFRESDVRYVLEVNANSGINKGDELDLDSEDDGPVMKVLTPDGETLMELKGGERIFSRKITKRLIKWAKKCEKTQNESDFKRLGQLMLDEIDALDTRKPEYVSVPED